MIDFDELTTATLAVIIHWVFSAFHCSQPTHAESLLFAFGTPLQNVGEVARRLGKVICGERKRRLLSGEFLDGCFKLAV